MKEFCTNGFPNRGQNTSQLPDAESTYRYMYVGTGSITRIVDRRADNSAVNVTGKLLAILAQKPSVILDDMMMNVVPVVSSTT